MQGVRLAFLDDEARHAPLLVEEARQADVDHEDFAVEARGNRAFREGMADRDPIHFEIEKELPEVVLQGFLISLRQAAVPKRAVLVLDDSVFELREVLELRPD